MTFTCFCNRLLLTLQVFLNPIKTFDRGARSTSVETTWYVAAFFDPLMIEKVAFAAIMRKLILLANLLIKSDWKWAKMALD